MKIFISLFAILLVNAACTLAPLSEPQTARTLTKGKSEWNFSAGGPIAFLGATYTHGLTDKFDAGLNLEFQGIGFLTGFYGRYRLTENNLSPWSLLFAGGLGTSTTYAYVGIVKSFMVSKKYEVSFNTRLNHFVWDFESNSQEDDAEDTLDDFIDSTRQDINGGYTYASANMTHTLWFNPKVGLGLSFTYLKFLGQDEGDLLKSSLNLHVNY